MPATWLDVGNADTEWSCSSKGEMPVNRRNTLAKWLGDSKPTSYATADTRSPADSILLARMILIPGMNWPTRLSFIHRQGSEQ